MSPDIFFEIASEKQVIDAFITNLVSWGVLCIIVLCIFFSLLIFTAWKLHSCMDILVACLTFVFFVLVGWTIIGWFSYEMTFGRFAKARVTPDVGVSLTYYGFNTRTEFIPWRDIEAVKSIGKKRLRQERYEWCQIQVLLRSFGDRKSVKNYLHPSSCHEIASSMQAHVGPLHRPEESRPLLSLRASLLLIFVAFLAGAWVWRSTCEDGLPLDPDVERRGLLQRSIDIETAERRGEQQRSIDIEIAERNAERKVPRRPASKHDREV